MSAGENMVRNVRGSSETEKYGEISEPTVEVTALAAVPWRQGGFDDGVNDEPPQEPVWNRVSNWLEPATGHSDRAPPTGFWIQLSQGHK